MYNNNLFIKFLVLILFSGPIALFAQTNMGFKLESFYTIQKEGDTHKNYGAVVSSLFMSVETKLSEIISAEGDFGFQINHDYMGPELIILAKYYTPYNFYGIIAAGNHWNIWFKNHQGYGGYAVSVPLIGCGFGYVLTKAVSFELKYFYPLVNEYANTAVRPEDDYRNLVLQKVNIYHIFKLGVNFSFEL